MSYSVVLVDRSGNPSPSFSCIINYDGTEIEVDAELTNKYINRSQSAHIISDNEVVSKHSVLGYNFYGDTIIDGVFASRSGHYILSISAALKAI